MFGWYMEKETSGKMPKLEVICGPMYCGKTEELLRRLRRANIAGKRVVAIKPSTDTRSEEIQSRSGAKAKGLLLDDVTLLERMTFDFDIVGIDEAQFFPAKELVEQIDLAIQNGQTVVIAGLDLNYRQEPFGAMPTLLCLADSVTKLSAICHSCGEDAMFTQRLIDGEPAPFNGPEVIVGSEDFYEARCRKCFQKA